jgi:hypothetical protein
MDRSQTDMSDTVAETPGKEPLAVTMTLHGEAVTAPVLRAMKDSLEVLGIAFTALDALDYTNIPSIPRSFLNFTVTTKEPLDAAERRAAYENWLLAKACQEMARALNEALQAAYFYLEMIGKPHEITTWGAVQEKMAEVKARANRMFFPELLKSVSEKLKTPLQFAEQYQSLQDMRNCMEHRAGIVGPKDTGGGTVLRLTLPSLDMVLQQDGVETILEAEPEQIMKAGSHIIIRKGIMTRDYALGERVVLTVTDFQKIAQACYIFTADIATKLPGVEPAKALSAP